MSSSFCDGSEKEEDVSATPQIHLPALSAIPFILLSEDHDLGKISRKICETAAFHPNIRCICTSSNTAFSLARRGMGIAFLPEIYARTTSFPDIHFFTPDHFHDTRDIDVYKRQLPASSHDLFPGRILTDVLRYLPCQQLYASNHPDRYLPSRSVRYCKKEL